MSVNAADVARLIKGEASAELRARFLSAVTSRQLQVIEMLKSVEEWARVRLNTHSPSRLSGVSESQSGKPTVTIHRKAAFWDEEGRPGAAEQPPAPGIKDLLDVIRGTATADAAARLKETLADPSSHLSRLLSDLKNEAIPNPPKASHKKKG